MPKTIMVALLVASGCAAAQTQLSEEEIGYGRFQQATTDQGQLIMQTTFKVGTECNNHLLRNKSVTVVNGVKITARCADKDLQAQVPYRITFKDPNVTEVRLYSRGECEDFISNLKNDLQKAALAAGKTVSLSDMGIVGYCDHES